MNARERSSDGRIVARLLSARISESSSRSLLASWTSPLLEGAGATCVPAFCWSPLWCPVAILLQRSSWITLTSALIANVKDSEEELACNQEVWPHNRPDADWDLHRLMLLGLLIVYLSVYDHHLHDLCYLFPLCAVWKHARGCTFLSSFIAFTGASQTA